MEENLKIKETLCSGSSDLSEINSGEINSDIKTILENGDIPEGWKRLSFN